MYITPLYTGGSSSSNGWIDEDLRRMVWAIQELQREIQRMDCELQEVRKFVEYVDATAPELRTAYHVSKRIE